VSNLNQFFKQVFNSLHAIEELVPTTFYEELFFWLILTDTWCGPATTTNAYCV
jgi:hypothetical protein